MGASDAAPNGIAYRWEEVALRLFCREKCNHLMVIFLAVKDFGIEPSLPMGIMSLIAWMRKHLFSLPFCQQVLVVLCFGLVMQVRWFSEACVASWVWLCFSCTSGTSNGSMWKKRTSNSAGTSKKGSGWMKLARIETMLLHE